jgi:hypothetical protein
MEQKAEHETAGRGGTSGRQWKRMEQKAEDRKAGRRWYFRQRMKQQVEDGTAGSGQNIRQDTE